MKRLIRTPGVQSLLAALLTGYLRATLATVRWTRQGEAIPEAVRAAGRGAIACFWHGRIALSPPAWPHITEQAQVAPRALISLSQDGEFVAKTMAWLGYPAIRGSSRKASDTAKKKGGSGAFREALAWIGGGGGLAITPDGPRGPAETMAEGAVRLAKITQAPVLLLGIACSPAIRLSSWDRTVCPLPFSRGAIVWGGPYYVSADATPADIARLRAEWGRALSDVTRQAEALVAPTKPPPLLAGYRLVTGLAEPLAPLILRLRAKKGKEDLERLGERLGRSSQSRPDGPLIWLHGASVGESLSILPLIQALRAGRPDVTLLVTSGTVTSAMLLKRRLPTGAIHQFVPLDTPGSAGRFLAAWRPDVAALVESELWPNLILGAREQGAKVALVSARLSEKSLEGWRRHPASARHLLTRFDLVMAQDDAVAAALARLGARDDGRLNLKLAGEPLPVEHAALERVRAAAGGRPVLVAASTHPGEEGLVLDAFAQVAGRTDRPLLVIVPRHPTRGPMVAALAAARGLSVRRQGAGEAFNGEAAVHVADGLGELGLWFRVASMTFVGGSLIEGVGGHNPLEPARLCAPMIVGPHVRNWRSVYDGLGERAVRVSDASGLAKAFAAALNDPQAARARAVAARDFADVGGEAVGAAADRLLSLLP